MPIVLRLSSQAACRFESPAQRLSAADIASIKQLHDTAARSLPQSSRQPLYTSGWSKKFENGGAEDNLSASSSFIANAHNDLYRSLLHEKRRLFGKIIEPMGGTPPPPPPLWIRHWCTHNQTIVLTSLLNPCETKSFFRIRCLHVVDGQNQSLNWYCHYYTDVSYYYVTAGRDGPFSPGSPHFLLCFICSYGMFMYFVDNFNMKLKNSGLNNHDDRLWGK